MGFAPSPSKYSLAWDPRTGNILFKTLSPLLSWPFLEFCRQCLSTPSCEQTSVWRLLVCKTPLGTKAILHLDNHGSQKSNAWFWPIITTIKNSNTCVLVGHLCCFVNNHWLWFSDIAQSNTHMLLFLYLKNMNKKPLVLDLWRGKGFESKNCWFQLFHNIQWTNVFHGKTHTKQVIL